MKKVKRYLFLALLLSFAGQTMMAGEVTEKEALEKAKRFLQGRTFQQKNLRRAATANTFAQDAFYVFNADDDKGFVIVSADDRTESILGYADTGRLDLNNLPENAAYWLQDYAQQIKSLGDAVNLAAPHRAPGAVKVDPMMTCKWDQGDPFNIDCPTDSKGQCYTGCTATAMAQVMYHYRWPESVAALPEYNVNRIDEFTIPALKATSFNWAKMRDTYIEKDKVKQYTEEEAKAVATLMRYCGQSIQMQYGSNSSAGNIHVGTMVNYFGFSKYAQEVSRSALPNDEWEKLIYDEMVAKRVVLYSGSNESSGHMFVIDGYDGKGLFHVNWGWGGYSDGFFVLGKLNPESKGIGGGPSDNGYPMAQTAIVGLQRPGTDEMVPLPILYSRTYIPEDGQTEFTRTSTSQDFKDIIVNSSFTYNGQYAPVFYYTFALFKDGKYVDYLTQTAQMDLNTEYSVGVGTFNFGSGLEDGTYEIQPIYNFASSEIDEGWKTTFMNYMASRVYATISGNTLKLTCSYPNAVTINKVDIEGDNVVYRPMKATITWTRPDTNEANENLFYLWIEGVKEPVGGVSSFIAKGGEEKLEMAFKSPKTGECKLYLTTDPEGKNKVYDIPGTITFKEMKKQEFISSWDEENLKTVGSEYILPINEFKPKVSLKNKNSYAYNDYVIFTLTPVDASNTPTGDAMTIRKLVNIAGNGNDNVQANFTDLVNGQRYQFCVYHYTNENDGTTYYTWMIQSFFTVNLSDGILSVKTTDKTDSPIYNLKGQRVDKSQKGLIIYKGRKYVNK